jgi:tetratricopeptide (TPR) repeat protein
VNNCFTLLLLVLLIEPACGFGQQASASKLESLMAAAQQAQAVHDYATAENVYRQAIRISPDMPELWANLGLMQRQAGDTQGAILSFQHANRLNPSLYVPNLFIGLYYSRAGKAAAAIPFLLKAETLNKTDPQAPLALGRAYVSAGKLSAAVQEFGRAVTLDPKLGPAWFSRGIALLDQVESDARKMTAEGQHSAFSQALFAQSLEKQARFSEAATVYKSLIDSWPQPPCMHSELGLSLLRKHDRAAAASEFAAERAAHPECGLAILEQARIAIDDGDNQQAIKILNELWNRDHGFVKSNAAILIEGLSSEQISAIAGMLSSQENQLIPKDLSDALLVAFNLSAPGVGDRIAGDNLHAPSAAEPLSGKHRTAEEYYASGQFEQCEHGLEPAPIARSADKLQLLAACSFFAGDNERASSAASALAALQPHSLQALYWSIQANERLALQSLARFQRLEPDSAGSHVLIGDIYNQLERYDDAQAEYRKALVIAPNDPAGMLGLATACLNNNDIEGAMGTARSALALSPEDPELNLVMAKVMLSHNKFAEAEPYLTKSLHAKPQMLPHVHALIGKVYAETGRTGDAIDQLKLGASSDEDGSIQYQLARLYRQLGDTRHASEALDRMKTIKQQRRDGGVKTIEDPDLSALESAPANASAP